jgi:hypothetical protein
MFTGSITHAGEPWAEAHRSRSKGIRVMPSRDDGDRRIAVTDENGQTRLLTDEEWQAEILRRAGVMEAYTEVGELLERRSWSSVVGVLMLHALDRMRAERRASNDEDAVWWGDVSERLADLVGFAGAAEKHEQ